MHTKKTNKLSFCPNKNSKITKLKKKKKKTFFCIGRYSRYSWYFFRYETGGLYEPVCLPVRYIPTIPIGTVQNWLPCLTITNKQISPLPLTLLLRSNIIFWLIFIFHRKMTKIPLGHAPRGGITNGLKLFLIGND